MLQPKTTETIQSQNVSPLPANIPITYIWYGKSIPEDYLISLSELRYPFNFIKDAELDRKFSRQIMDIEKSDYYRLQYLYEYGGIYSDLDNIIDYACLMNLLEPYRKQDKLVFMTDGKHTRAKIKQMTNNLIFAPYPKMPILKKMLHQVDQKKGKIWNFAGMRHVAKYSQPLEVNMDKCVKHIGDWSWFAASNQVLGKDSGPNNKFRAKLTKKKRDLIRQNSTFHKKIFSIRASNTKLQNQLKKLKVQYKSAIEELYRIKKNQAEKNKEKKNEAKKSIVVQKDKKPQKVIKQAPKQAQIPKLGNDDAWKKQILTMQNQIQHLSLQNQDIQLERKATLYATGGSIIILLILILIGIKLIRKKNSTFQNKTGISQRRLADESKLESG